MNTIDAVKELETKIAKLVVFDSGGLAYVRPDLWQQIEQIGYSTCPAFGSAFQCARLHRMSEVDKLRLINSYLLLQIMHESAQLQRLVESGLITSLDLKHWIDFVDPQKGKE